MAKPKLVLKTFVGTFSGKVIAAITHKSYTDLVRFYKGRLPFKLSPVTIGVVRAALSHATCNINRKDKLD